MDSLDRSKYTVHSDLPGQEAAGGETIPPDICVTPLKPDIDILNMAHFQQTSHLSKLPSNYLK